MGYEWNKYNQIYYDYDYFFFKVVQGYKFNIFYFDFIDKIKVLIFKIIWEYGCRKGEFLVFVGFEDICFICFIVGLFYEDIVFCIVDCEWDYSVKKECGFKSSFDKVCIYVCDLCNILWCCLVGECYVVLFVVVVWCKV